MPWTTTPPPTTAWEGESAPVTAYERQSQAGASYVPVDPTSTLFFSINGPVLQLTGGTLLTLTAGQPIELEGAAVDWQAVLAGSGAYVPQPPNSSVWVPA